MRFWEKGLNPEQLRAVLTTEGPVLILAGAGSGKTKTLTHRIAYLIDEKKVSPDNILAVTFTNKAAGEMRERIERLLSQSEAAEYGGLQLPQYIGTFHNICSRILRREIETLGYGKRFNILDSQDQETLVKRAMKALEINPDQVKPRSILDAISRAKNAFIDAEQFALSAESYYEEIIAKVYGHYQKELRATNALDFDDLIMLTVKLFQEHQNVLEKYQDVFRYILVDEYQDTNYPQYLLVYLLAKKHNNIFVIGDDYQSIYGWRQADIRNILNFEKDYTKAAVITLDRNYRSTQIILDAADGIISKNKNQRHKKLWTEIEAGELITLVPAEDEEAEARFVAETILREHTGGRPFSHFAVLYRTNAQSRIIEEMFLRHSINYRVVGGLKFYQRKEIKDMIAYVRLLENPRDALALERIGNEPKRGLGKATLEKWIAFGRESALDLFAAGYKLTTEKSGLKESKIKVIRDFVDIFLQLRSEIDARADMRFLELLDTITKRSGYFASLADGTTEGEVRQENVRELLSVAQKYNDMPLSEALHHFLEEVALSSDTDEISKESDVVNVMTLHSSKGLEFPVVFIAGLEEGIFPHSRSALSPSDLEEERRLMYVGLTRAKEKIYLLYTLERTIFGGVQVNPPSRFLQEIPQHLVDEVTCVSSGMLGRRHSQKSRNYFSVVSKKQSAFAVTAKSISQEKSGESGMREKPLALDDVRPGDMVEHPQFGSGLVISIVGTLATIAFKRSGVKKMMLGVAPLKRQ
ncbi:MAG: UvrD-helicase domain-containing protein [Candidatus Moranbacteria bacterium]|nr:UvrD-helicase domain-containing protein [Candidatus Moranbacteria bacterium]